MRITTPYLTEEARLADLYSYHILDTGEEKDFTDLVELVKELYDCPVVALTFVDRDRLWFKAIKGVEAKEAPRADSPCNYAIESKELMVVKDLRADERFLRNALLTQVLGLCFYAGAPIVSSAGYVLGTVCLYDHRPRRLSAKQGLGLMAVANQASRLLELKLKNSLLKKQGEELLQAEKSLTRAVLLQQEKERMTIGTELHENIAQGLAAAKLYLDVMGQSIDHPFVKRSSETVAQLLQQVKTLTHTLVPTTLKNTGLKNLLQILCERYREQYGFKVAFGYEGEEAVSPRLSLVLYRMVEEAFENVRLHAAAMAISLSVEVADAIEIIVADDGVGLNPQDFKKGYGISAITSVAEYYGGTVDLISGEQKGCRLMLLIPLAVEEMSER